MWLQIWTLMFLLGWAAGPLVYMGWEKVQAKRQTRRMCRQVRESRGTRPR